MRIVGRVLLESQPLSSKRLHAKLKNAKILQEWNAATKIQRMFRGYLARDYIALRKKLEG